MRPHRQQPTRLPRPWDSPGKNTGVGCHFLLQCMKVKSESEVAQSCLTLSDPMDCSPPDSSIHGIFQARVLEWGAIAFSGLQSRGPQRVGHNGATEHTHILPGSWNPLVDILKVFLECLSLPSRALLRFAGLPRATRVCQPKVTVMTSTCPGPASPSHMCPSRHFSLSKKTREANSRFQINSNPLTRHESLLV